MPKDYSTLPATHVRRADRAMNDDVWIREKLHQAPVGVLATVHGDQPFVNHNLFVYDEAENAIYMHTANVGRTRANVEGAEKVCFSISDMGRLLPADVALEFSVEYTGVVVFGHATVINDDAQATQALQMLLDKYFPHLTPGKDYRPVVEEELRRTTVYRIDIENWSGKRKQVEPDFPGAFFYGELPNSQSEEVG